MKQQVLRPVDLAVALRLALEPEERYESLAHALGVSLSTAHQAVGRLQGGGLVDAERRTNRRALLEFLAHGVRHAFFAELGPETRGVPTAHSAPPLAEEIMAEEQFVWPSASGGSRGTAVSPLYEGATDVLERDPRLYQVLALVDALRIGRARERRLALEHLERLLAPQDQGS